MLTSRNSLTLTTKQYQMATTSLYKIPKETVSIAADNSLTYNEAAFELPEQLSHIQKSIDVSAFIQTLSDNWDDEGGVAVSLDLYKSAIGFLKKHALFVFKTFDKIIAEPDIVPVKDGTIDLEWHTPYARMLINIKNNNIASYYGDNLSNLNSIKGKVATDEVELFLATWMTKLSI